MTVTERPQSPSAEGRLSGKRILITGTGRGQGAAAQDLFCSQGAHVVGCDKIAGSAARTALGLSKQGLRASGHDVDLADPEAARSWVSDAAAEMGGLDVLYNNAGLPAFAPFAEMTLDQWRSTLVNELEILFTVTSAAWPHLIAEGASVINTGSISASYGVARLGTVAHSAAKGGVLGFTKQLAAEGAAHGVRVNAISPGFVDSPGTSVVPAETKQWIIGLHPLGRAALPMDIAQCALFLASDESGFVTGAEIMVDAGFSAART